MYLINKVSLFLLLGEEAAHSGDEYHVILRFNGGWEVKRNNAMRVSVHWNTKSLVLMV